MFAPASKNNLVTLQISKSDGPINSLKKKKLVTLSLIGSLLIAISGVIFLYIAYQDEELDVELAFN